MSQSPPDLVSAEGRAAWRAELRSIMPWTRLAGLALVAAGAFGLLWTQHLGAQMASPRGLISLALLVIGWGLLAVVIIKRTAHQRRRLSGV